MEDSRLDARGILRGACNRCDCTSYKCSVSLKCATCRHPPGIHAKLQPPAQALASASSKYDWSEVKYLTNPPDSSAINLTSSGPDFQEDGADFHESELKPKPVKKRMPISQDSSLSSAINLVSHEHTGLAPPSSAQFLQITDIDGPGNTFCSADETSKFPKVNLRKQAWLFSNKDYDNDDWSQYKAEDEDSSQNKIQFAIPPDLLCIGCGNKEKYKKDDGTYYDYCGNACRNYYRRNNTKASPVSHHRCVRCGKPKSQKDDGTYHDHCGKKCRDALPIFQSQIMMPPTGTDGAGISQVSITLDDQAGSPSSILFQQMWAKGAYPQVEHIFAISNTVLLQQQFNSYKRLVSCVTVEQHFHGTSLVCDLTRNKVLCGDQACGVCGISANGFSYHQIGHNISFQRFGQGFYLSPNSSKCHDYTQGYKGSGYRALLLCDVCPGKKYTTYKTDKTLKAPPNDCNCVYGEAGQDLNYSEIVLYDHRAILPRYIILYKRDGTNKLIP